jgi:hypothetical protein
MNTTILERDSSATTSDWAAFSRDDLVAREIRGYHLRHRFRCALETGTWKGHTTVTLARMFPKVVTIEIDRERFEANKPRMGQFPNVTALHGHSPDVLVGLVADLEYPLFAFLDAHWEENWPLRDELKILLSVRRPKLIMIHDFKVPGRDFGYDRYGKNECSLDYVGDLLPHEECRYRFNGYVAPQSERRGVIFIEHLLP